MEISNFNTFYNINKNNLTVSLKTVKFLNVLDKSITNFFLDKYVYVTDNLKGIISNNDNEHLFTIDNFGTLKELIDFVLKNDTKYKQTKEIKMIAVIDFKDLDNYDDSFIIDLLNILSFSHLQFPIRFFFYTENLYLYKDKFWFETIMNFVDDFTIGNLDDKDKKILLEEGIINEENIDKMLEKDDILIHKNKN